MSSAVTTGETAQQAGDRTLEQVITALQDGNNFKVEAGAGAGKTYTLIQTLIYILNNRETFLPHPGQRVACLTYTNVARDEIVARTDASPYIYADTLHGFLWEMIRPYQQSLVRIISDLPEWQEHIHDRYIENFSVEYELGIRDIRRDSLALHHDDVPRLAVDLLGNQKFRALIKDKFPVIFVDEYQDTPVGLAEALLDGKSGRGSIIGLFGDHWQQIYDDTCGAIDHPDLITIPKNANFRSDHTIVDFLNHLRPELLQSPAPDAGAGKVTIYHTNSWVGDRLAGYFKGQIPDEAIQFSLRWLNSNSYRAEKDGETKVLMLTHKAIAKELGYASIAQCFRYSDSFIRKGDPIIKFLVDIIEPGIEAFNNRRFGELFNLLGGSKPLLKGSADKQRWSVFWQNLAAHGSELTIGQIIDECTSQTLFGLPAEVTRLDAKYNAAIKDGLALDRRLEEYGKLRLVRYSELKALYVYLKDETVFSTKHGVKGAEFSNVVVVIGKGWNKYNFAKMLTSYRRIESLDENERTAFERARNLFYVAVSRAQHNLVLLFVQELEENELATLREWVGEDRLIPVNFDGYPLND